jgi:polysaccharide biosynthesis protein PslJ
MRVVQGEDRRGPIASSVVVLGALAVLAFTTIGHQSVATVAPITAVVVVAAVAYKKILAWQTLIGLILVSIVFIPIRRYELPASLPFHLEPYRLLVAFVAVGWLTSLLIDPRVRLRTSGLEAPLGLYVMTILISLLANSHRVGTVSGEVYKRLAFFASFFILMYLIIGVIRRWRDVDLIARLLVVFGAILGVFAIIESWTYYNVFNHLSAVVPFLHLQVQNVPTLASRGGRLRVFASAQHPIALGALFAMLVPLGAYRAWCYKRWYWWIATLLLLLGALVTGSRTAIVMLLVEAGIFLWLRPVDVRRFWPALIPILLLVHTAAPGALGSIRASFFPKGGIVAQQKNTPVGSGRLATLGPALHTEFKDPLVGEGFATRVTKPTPLVPVPNGPILDDQWLGILLETGVFGVACLLWMFIRFIRRAGREAKRDLSPRGWLLTAIAAGVAGYAVGMLFYDAFEFIQVTFMLFIFMGLGISAVAAAPQTQEVLEPQPTTRFTPGRLTPRGEPA